MKRRLFSRRLPCRIATLFARRAHSGPPLARAQISLEPLLIAADKMLMVRVTKAAACMKNENPQSNYYIQY